MAYTIVRISKEKIHIMDDGRSLTFSLEENQQVPEEFKEGEELDIVIHQDHPAAIAMGMTSGYYKMTHIPSGKTFQTWHRADQWQVK